MEAVARTGTKSRRWALVKAFSLLAFIALAVVLMRFTPAKQFLTPQVLGRLLDRAGIWAPLVFVLVYTVGVCLFVPGALITALGGTLFGPLRGFAYVYLGAMCGAVAAFWIGRTLGRDFAAAHIGQRLKKYDASIERNGFTTVLYLRLIYFPFTPLNFGLGLTRVRFRDYFWGTALGILVGTFLITFFVGTLKEVWASGDWHRLGSYQVLLPCALFLASFFIPKLVKAIRREP